jgi:hypothetical protein
VKKLGAAALAAFVVSIALVSQTSTAEAHCIDVTPRGGGQGVTCNVMAGDFSAGWVGSPLFAGDHPGQGLVPGGPGGMFKMSPSHAGGLTNACEAIRDSGNGTVDIYGPGGPGCPHGE